MGYQDSGNRSCAFHNGNHNGDNYGNNKTIQKLFEIAFLSLNLCVEFFETNDLRYDISPHRGTDSRTDQFRRTFGVGSLP